MIENGTGSGLICVIDDDEDVRDSLRTLLRSADYNVRAFAEPEEFLACDAADSAACLILDINLGCANGLDFQEELRENATAVPIILISGVGDVPMTVRGMKAGAVTFLTKPFDEDAMLVAINEAVASHDARRREMAALTSVQERYESLTPRERDLFGLVTAGLMNKQIAGRLEISEITAKIHRGNMVKKMKADSVADLVRMAETLGIREAATRYNRGPGQQTC
ncbi:response regulator transcription factor [Rhizobium laguerreae]|uniref:response regulator transcription factor n=1 Tax=Rhizobium laguerreae TaxID=1076926 RepID=UPI001C90533A|nr:response regulator [Rhizobium laguerreae]MBY3088883.1 response regulator transcription factor [Rhizobium laguerreae]MBY3150591.1 response regulator transcription factor [Rhizobium laguerreae]